MRGIFRTGLFIALACISSVSARSGEAPPLTNEDIVNFVKAGLLPRLIIDRIGDGANSFDLSTQGAIALKENGVPDEVIAAMQVSGMGVGSRPGIGASGPAPLPALRAAPPVLQTPSGFSAPPEIPAWQAGSPGVSPGAGSPDVNADRLRNELISIATGTPESRRNAVAWMQANRGAVLPLLREALNDTRPETHAAAIHALGGVGDRDSVTAIRLRISNPSALVRQNAAEALVKLGDTDAVSAAERVLAQPIDPKDGFIRLIGYAKAARASGELGAIVANAASPLDRAAAAWALAEIGPSASAAFPVVEKALSGDSDSAVRREAARAVAAFRAPTSAQLLQSACRKDPEVRKTTLAAMADYPETAEFLISVMNLGADQIAADELDTARASLARITGQDFALDGQRWSAWFAQNGSRFAATAPAPTIGGGTGQLSSVPQPGRSALGGSIPSAPGSGQATEQRKGVDVAQWGIIVDSSEIPMAPELDGPARAGGGGLPGLGGLLGAGQGGDSPMALSASDFDETGGRAAPLAGPPGVSGPGAAQGGGLGGGSMFRNWNEQAQAPSREAPAPASGSAWGGAEQQPGGGFAPPAASTASAPAGGPGLRLPLPPMGGGMTSDLSTTAVSPPPAAVTAPSATGAMQPYGSTAPGLVQPYSTPDPYAGYSTGPAPASAVPYDSYGGGYQSGAPTGPTVTWPAPDPHLDLSNYVGTNTYTDEVRSDNTQGTADLAPNAPSFSIPTMAAVEDYPIVTESGNQVFDPDSYVPAPPSAVAPTLDPEAVSGALDAQAAQVDGGKGNAIAFPGDDDTFGLGDPMFEGDAVPATRRGGMPPPPGGGSAEYDDDEDDSDEEEEEEEEETPSQRRRVRESVIVSGKVPSGDKPAVAAPKAPAAAPAKREKTTARPPRGASVWVPGDDDAPEVATPPPAPAVRERGAPAPRVVEEVDDTSFQIIDPPTAEYEAPDFEVDDVPASGPEEGRTEGTADEGFLTLPPAGFSLSTPDSPTSGETEEDGGPFGGFVPPAPASGTAGDSDADADEEEEEYVTESDLGAATPAEAGILPLPGSVVTGSDEADDGAFEEGSSIPPLSLPLPGGAAEEAYNEYDSGGDGMPQISDDSGVSAGDDGGFGDWDSPGTFDGFEAPDASFPAAGSAAPARGESVAPPPALAPPPAGIGLPQDLLDGDFSSLPPIGAESGNSAETVSPPPFAMPQIQLPVPVAGDDE